MFIDLRALLISWCLPWDPGVKVEETLWSGWKRSECYSALSSFFFDTKLSDLTPPLFFDGGLILYRTSTILSARSNSSSSGSSWASSAFLLAGRFLFSLLS